MAASSSAVSVLAPNGRRQTVKVSPNTPLLQVLEEVSKKQGFKPEEHGLKFQRNVLDLTLQWRFASLPNNAKLEVVPSTRSHGGAENSVRIALQLEEGTRFQSSFSSSQSLWDLVSHFPQTRITELDESGSTPVCVYMRDEVSGKEALKKTTLKSLGLTGGSAIVRYVLKRSQPNESLETSADSSSHMVSPTCATRPDKPLEPIPVLTPEQTPSKSPESAEPMCQTSSTQQEEPEQSHGQQQDVIPKTQPSGGMSEHEVDEEQPGPSHENHSHSAPANDFVPFSGGGQRLGGSGSEQLKESSSFLSLSALSSGPPKAKKAKPCRDVQRPADAACGAKDSEDAAEYLEPVDREPLVFHLDTAVQRHSDSEELPDEFFEVTVDDIRKRFSQLKSERRMLEEAPLITRTLREAQNKEKMDRYPKVVLRVQFPDRRVLQGFFRPLETVAALRHFVKTHLHDPELPFYLFIAPPKTILDDPNATLFQANLFPAALVYLGSDAKTECYLHSELVDSSVSALEADELISGCMPRSPHPSSSSAAPEESRLLDTETNGASRSPQGAGEYPEDYEHCQAPKPVRTDPAKVPKWLKLPGKKS